MLLKHMTATITRTSSHHISTASSGRTMSRNFLSMNSELRKGDFLLSNNGEYKAVFQEDGNFVVYGWKPIWDSKTAGNPNAKRLIMQEDCNCVMYAGSKALWHTNTHRKNVKMCRLTLGNDGFLVVDNDGEELWKSTK
ncbi:hypothetical protein HF521_003493 [Silurus meridionalis]|uniref:Bulb-type lectin domain-containing protein n=2 Tax=Silurus meridionalis TaxID=175797 RepID=A0A8T0AZW4_SILME|nr:hypothetical protein HF521_003493 [Silurus meridionalis]